MAHRTTMNWWKRKMAAHSERELPIPDAAVKDETALEILRVWESEGGLQCSLRVGLDLRDKRDNAAAWGRAIADMAYEIAIAVKSSRGTPERATITRIQEAFEAEIREDRPDVRGESIE